MARRRAAPPPREPSPDDRIGAGYHPHYIIYEDGSFAIVKTEWGLRPVVVERGFPDPRSAIERLGDLNTAP